MQSNFAQISSDILGIVLHFYSCDPEELLTVAKTNKAFFGALYHTRCLNSWNCICKITSYTKMKVFQNLEKLIICYSCAPKDSVEKFVNAAGNLECLKNLEIRKNMKKCPEHSKSNDPTDEENEKLPSEENDNPERKNTNPFKKLESFRLLAETGNSRRKFLDVLESVNEQNCKLKYLTLCLDGVKFLSSKLMVKFKNLQTLDFSGCGRLDLRELKQLKQISVFYPCCQTKTSNNKNFKTYTLVDSPVLNKVYIKDKELDTNWIAGGTMNWVFSESVKELSLDDTVILGLENNSRVLETFQNAKNIATLSIRCILKKNTDIEKMLKILETFNFVKRIFFLFVHVCENPFHICEIAKYASKKLKTVILRIFSSSVELCNCDLSLVKTRKLKKLVIHQVITKEKEEQNMSSSIEGLVKSNPSLIVNQHKKCKCKQ